MRSSVNLFSNVENQMCIIALKIEKPQPSKVPMGAQGLPARFPYAILLNLPAFQPDSLELGILAKEAYFYNPGLSLPVTCSI